MELSSLGDCFEAAVDPKFYEDVLAVITHGKEAYGQLLGNFRDGHSLVHEGKHLGLPLCEQIVAGIQGSLLCRDAFRRLGFGKAKVNECVLARTIEQHHRANRELLACPVRS